MRDEEDRVAPGAQRLDDAEQPLDLVRRQRRGRLVHHDHPRVRRQRLRDLDELLIGDREPPSEPVRVEPDAELLEQLGGLAPHPSPVDSSEALERLDADEDVLGDAQVGEERRLLEDDRDAGGLRLLGVVEDRLLAVDQESAGVGAVHAGEDLDERGLAGAVLADEAVDLARRATRCAPSSSACTAPKLFCACSREMTGASGGVVTVGRSEDGAPRWRGAPVRPRT